MKRNISAVRRRAESCLLTLPGALYHAVHDYPGSVGAVAGAFERNAGTFGNRLNPGQSHALTVREFEQIASFTRDVRILQTVCSWFSAGYFFLPEGQLGDGSLFEQSALLSKEVAELMAAVSETLADGNVNEDDVNALEKALMELCAVAKGLIEQAKVVGGYTKPVLHQGAA